MSQFTTVALTGDRVLVKGTDVFGNEGQTVLDGAAWAEVKRHRAFHEAEGSFDTAVEEFFAPLMEASEKLQQAIATPALDPDSYVVLVEGEEATEGRSQEVIKLDTDSIVLRLIERGDTDRLVWVMDQLEVMQVEDTPDTDVTEQANDTQV